MNALPQEDGSYFGPEKSAPAHVLPEDAEAAWAEVNKMHQALRAPADWNHRSPSPEETGEFQKQVIQKAWEFSKKALEFLTRFPTNENTRDARVLVVHSLTHAVAAGDAAAEQEIREYVATVLKDVTLPEDNRAMVLCYAGNATFMKKVGMRLFTEGMEKLAEEFKENGIESTRSALKEFPTNSFLYTMLVAGAKRSKPERQKTLAKEIINSSGAPAVAKALAEHLLKGTRPYEIGKPVPIRFTALDGRVVDLDSLKGKVILVEFWSMGCAPCVSHIPALKSNYEKFHECGLEIVGINLDDKESVLRRFIEEQKLPWPQHFDGKGWENQFAVRYGIFGIPTTWLIDKRGHLRYTQSRGDERLIASLLAEPG